MRKLLITLLFAAFCLEPSAVYAEPVDGSQQESGSRYKPGLVFSGHVGANLLSRFVGGGSTSVNRIGFQVGADGRYYFSPNVGLMLGTQFVSRGIGDSAFFLDVPLALTFRYSGTIFEGAGGFSHFDLGTFFSIPFGDFRPSISADNKTNVGIYLGGGTAFPVSEGLKLGFGSWFKFGLTSAVDLGIADKLFEVGLGFMVYFD